MRVFLIFAIFLVFVVLMYRKKVNTLVGLPITAVLIALVAGIPIPAILDEVISGGALRLHNPIIVILFGATLAEVVKRSGIVEVLIKNTAEFLGDRLILISIFLMLVISVLFTVLSGLGAIVMVGSIVFPIMISLGISRLLSASIFLIGLSLGGLLNLINWSLYEEVLKLGQKEILFYTVRFVPMVAFISLAFVIIELRRERVSSFRLQLPNKSDAKKISIFAYLTPVVPVLTILVSSLFGYSFPIITAMALGIVYGTLSAPAHVGSRVRLLTKSIFDGISQVGPAIALMIGVGMLLKAVAHPTVGALLNPVMNQIMPTTALGYVLLFTLCAPLALFRGPLNIWGMGSGLVTLMLGTGHLPGAAIMAALTAVGQIQGVSDPTNTSNVWIAGYLGTDVIKIMRKTLPYAWAMALAGLILGAALYY